MRRGLFLLLAAITPVYVWRLSQPGFSDTEGMFAEPAWEMVESGDWITPRMNGEPFLTKPPLMYWLPAMTFAGMGPTEYARLWPMGAALATVFVTGLIGQELFGEVAGLTAAAVLATCVGFLLEARMLRADMALVLTVVLALYWYVRLRRGAGAGAGAAFWSTLSLGVMDKGLVSPVLVGGTIALYELTTGELRLRTLRARLQALHAAWGALLMAALIAPWHLAAGIRKPGFLWDYIVNQHVLFFFDKKLPRDSIPDSLGFFWTMFFLRGLPWSLLLPLAVVQSWQEADKGLREPLHRMPLLWLVTVLGLFSLAVSRLEHYSLPALPALALLIGRFLSQASVFHTKGFPGELIAILMLTAIAPLALIFVNPTLLLVNLEPALAGYGLEPLVRPAFLILGIGLLGLIACVHRQRCRAALGVGIVTTVILFPLVHIARERVDALFSWRPFARLIRATAPPGSRIFFRAEDEYQLCGGLNFYLQQRLDLLAPPDWTPPTFLTGRADRLFTPQAEFERQWRLGAGTLVSDAVATSSDEARLVPGPYRLLARAGERVVLQPDLSRSSQPPRQDNPVSTSPRTTKDQ